MFTSLQCTSVGPGTGRQMPYGAGLTGACFVLFEPVVSCSVPTAVTFKNVSLRADIGIIALTKAESL